LLITLLLHAAAGKKLGAKRNIKDFALLIAIRIGAKLLPLVVVVLLERS